MLNPGDFAVSNHESPNGFVSVATAERLRQVSVLEDFKARHPDVYARAVEATDLSQGTEQVAVDLLSPERVQLVAVESSTPTAVQQPASDTHIQHGDKVSD